VYLTEFVPPLPRLGHLLGPDAPECHPLAELVLEADKQDTPEQQEHEDTRTRSEREHDRSGDSRIEAKQDASREQHPQFESVVSDHCIRLLVINTQKGNVCEQPVSTGETDS
jgi:hypothetical protein